MRRSCGYTQMVTSGFMKEGKREGGKSKPPNRIKCLSYKGIFFWLLDISRPKLLGCVLYHKQALKCFIGHLELIPLNDLSSFAV